MALSTARKPIDAKRIKRKAGMKSNKYFVFDLDNTLVKTNRANNQSYKDAIFAVTGKSIVITKNRFTRDDLASTFPDLSIIQMEMVINAKETCYPNHITETKLNRQLVKILELLYDEGCKPILLTESRKTRTQQVCNYHKVTHFFSSIYCKEDYPNLTKYEFLRSLGIQVGTVVLFENEQAEIRKAIQCGLNENQIIKVKF